MQHESFYSNFHKCVIVRLTKYEARKIYDQNGILFVNPSKMSFENPWTMAHQVGEGREEIKFESYCNHFRAYNCSYQTGLYIKFYTTASEYRRYFGETKEKLSPKYHKS